MFSHWDESVSASRSVASSMDRARPHVPDTSTAPTATETVSARHTILDERTVVIGDFAVDEVPSREFGVRTGG